MELGVPGPDRRLSWQPPAGAPAVHPQPLPRGGGRCLGPDKAGRASRLRDQSAPAPRTPRSRVAGSGAAGKRAASGGSVPAQAPHCPGETRVSPAALGRGVAQPPGESADSRSGRDSPAGEPGRLSSPQMKASDPLPRPSLGNQIQGTWYRIYPHNFLL